MDNYHRKGDTINIINATVAYTSGVPDVIGVLLAIPVTDIAIGSDGAAAIDGSFVLPKASATVIAQGALVGWDDVAKQVVATAAIGNLAGFGVALDAAASGATTVNVRLLPGQGAIA